MDPLQRNRLGTQLGPCHTFQITALRKEQSEVLAARLQAAKEREARLKAEAGSDDEIVFSDEEDE